LNSFNCVFTGRSCVNYHRNCDGIEKYIPGHAFPSSAPQVPLTSIEHTRVHTSYRVHIWECGLLLGKYLLLGRRETPESVYEVLRARQSSFLGPTRCLWAMAGKIKVRCQMTSKSLRSIRKKDNKKSFLLSRVSVVSARRSYLASR
jgi:hypothetical protein